MTRGSLTQSTGDSSTAGFRRGSHSRRVPSAPYRAMVGAGLHAGDHAELDEVDHAVGEQPVRQGRGPAQARRADRSLGDGADARLTGAVVIRSAT